MGRRINDRRKKASLLQAMTGALIPVATIALAAMLYRHVPPQIRTRPPQAGDYWHGCNDARAAGTAPIYEGEPGYRPDMDGDNDGIACEAPHW